jgi:hypothetical protein
MLDLLGAAALAAQIPNLTPAQAATVDLEDQARTEAINASPPGRTLGLLEGADVALEISEEDSEMTLGYAWDRVRRTVTGDGRGVRISHSTLNLKLTLPVGGADNLLSSKTFDGFAAGPKIGVGWTWFGWTSRDRFDEAAFGKIMNAAVRRCKDGDGPKKLTEEECSRYEGRPNRRFAIDYSGVSEARINSTLLNSALGFGVQGKLGFDVFDYRTPATLDENSQTLPNFTATASVFYFPSDGISLLSGFIEYENSFEAQDAEILCRPVVVVPNDDCASAAPGPPSNVETLSPGIEYRRVLGSVAGLGKFAIAPLAKYDVIGHTYKVELPIYLSPEGDSDFLPGLSLSYDSGDEGFVVGVFLKKTFGLGR